MNNVNLIGRLTRDPEVRYTANNFPICTFAVAIDRWSKEVKKTNYIPVKALGKTAENCGRYLAKGKLVGVDGSIETDSYEKDGIKHYTWEVLASAVEFLEWGEKKNGQPAEEKAADQPSEQWKQTQAAINETLGVNVQYAGIEEDDPPF